MTNLIDLKARLCRDPEFTAAYNALGPLPTAATQQSNTTITLQQALAAGTSADSLRAVADWNERRGYDERRRKARARHKAQAVALRAVADAIEDSGYVARAA